MAGGRWELLFLFKRIYENGFQMIFKQMLRFRIFWQRVVRLNKEKKLWKKN